MSSVKKNILWNLSSNILPLIAGLVLIPKIIAVYDLEIFGLIALAWGVIGYFSLFDLGLSRALTQLVSKYIGGNKSPTEIAQLIRTGFFSMWILGIVGGIVLWLSSPLIIHSMIEISSALETDTFRAFALLALSIPIVVHTTGLRAVLDALHLFKISSLIRTILGIGSFIGPYLIAFLNPSLVNAVISLMIIRLIVWVLHLIAVTRSKILATKTPLLNFSQLKTLLHFGSWMTISNIISPIMEYMDRFMIAAVLSLSAASYYVAPNQVVIRLLAVPVAISGVLFPIFSQCWQKDPNYSAHLLKQGFSYVILIIFPPAVFLAFFANEWLSLWLTPEFAIQARLVVVWLTIGVMMNGAAQILYAKVQGTGHSDWTAKLHLAEVLPYLLILFLSLHQWGVVGAALAWTIRVTADFLGLLVMVIKINREILTKIYTTLLMLISGVVVLILSAFNFSLFTRSIETSFILLIYLLILHRELRADGILEKMIRFIKLKFT